MNQPSLAKLHALVIELYKSGMKEEAELVNWACDKLSIVAVEMTRNSELKEKLTSKIK